MTLLIIWREVLDDRIWLVSDSRLSAPGQSGDVRFTDRAAKILEAEVVLRDAERNAPPLQSRTLGFAYVGSSLIALQAYSAVLPLWSRLQSSNDQVLPSIGECAAHLGKFVGAYSLEVAASGLDAGCKCILFGYDERHAAVEAWLVKVHADRSGIETAVRELPLPRGTMEMFGSGRANATKELQKLNVSGGWHRQPLEMIRKQLKIDAPGGVGGGVQMGVATKEGFELCFDAQPFTVGSPVGEALVTMRYRGFDFNEIAQVGHAFATLRGIGG